MTPSEVPNRYSDPAKYILHPTDFSDESASAFAHALRVALTNKANIALLHVGDDKEQEWEQFPSFRRTLSNWGLLDADAKRADVAKLGIGIEKVMADANDVPGAIAGYLAEHNIDLMVLATEGRRGLAAMVKRSVSEEAARRTQVPTLFVPAAGRGCVSMDAGEVTMTQVLIPVDHDPPCGAAIERGLRAIQAFGTENSQVTLLHVGSEKSFPDVDIPAGDWQIVRSVRRGDPVSAILGAADELAANLIIMVTKGTDGFLDVLRGTTTEQVLRKAPCPVLSVPALF